VGKKDSQHINYDNCKYCGDDLTEAHGLRQAIGICELCEEHIFSSYKNRKKKKKPTYNLG